MELDKAASILKLLGDETRLTMVRILADHDCCVCEFVEIFQISQPAVSQHLRKLKDLNLVKEERRGQWIFYSLNIDNKYYPFVADILAHVPNQIKRLEQLEKDGKRITCC